MPRHDERGAASLVQTVLVAPALLFVLMLIVQTALVAHAQSVAEAAAQQGVEVGRRADATEAQARAEADRYLDSLGPRMLTSRQVQVDEDPESVSVTITGQVISLVPGFSPQISRTATGPRERFVAPVQAP